MNIGGAVVRRLLTQSEALVFNLNKASDLTTADATAAAVYQAGESHVDRRSRAPWRA